MTEEPKKHAHYFKGGHKDQGKDIQEAIDTLQRWQEMRVEDQRGEW